MSPALLDAESIYYLLLTLRGRRWFAIVSKAEAAFVPHCWRNRQSVLAVSSLRVSFTSGIIVSARDKVIEAVSSLAVYDARTCKVVSSRYPSMEVNNG